MQKPDWGRSSIEALAVGVAVYLVMRFAVPHSIGSEARSLIAAAVAFVAATIALRFGRTSASG